MWLNQAMPNHIAIDLTGSCVAPWQDASCGGRFFRRRRWRRNDAHRLRSKFLKTRLGTFGGSRAFCKQIGISVFQYHIQL